MSHPEIDPLLGQTISEKYEIRELLGIGAMGKVYRAHHLPLDKPVALKVLLKGPEVTTNQAKRFMQEARAASRIDHPNVIRVLDFGRSQDNLLYLIMEFIEGVDLSTVCAAEGALPAARVASIMRQTFAALASAHDASVIHRDVKPGNIMLVDREVNGRGPVDVVKVCDFGLAKISDPDPTKKLSPLTAQGAIFGTPSYMSPEQARGQTMDARSDIYSCGVVAYKLLTGYTPFRSESATEVMLGHIRDEAPPFSDFGVDVPPPLARVVERSMKKDPGERYPDAHEAAEALDLFLAKLGRRERAETSIDDLPPESVDAPLRTLIDAEPPASVRKLDALRLDTIPPEQVPTVRSEAPRPSASRPQDADEAPAETIDTAPTVALPSPVPSPRAQPEAPPGRRSNRTLLTALVLMLLAGLAGLLLWSAGSRDVASIPREAEDGPSDAQRR